jgi:hypothetical protein
MTNGHGTHAAARERGRDAPAKTIGTATPGAERHADCLCGRGEWA